MENSNQVIIEEKYIPKYRKVFGKTLAEVKNAVLKRVKEKYPKEKIDELLLKGKKQEAYNLLAKAFGKFIAEVKHVAYEPNLSFRFNLYQQPQSSSQQHIPQKEHDQKDLSHELFINPDYAKSFMEEYSIGIKTPDLLRVMEFLKYSNKTTASPQLTENYDCLVESESCPLPKQTLARLLGESPGTLPAGYKIDHTPASYQVKEKFILRRKKAVELVEIKQLTENETEPVKDSGPAANSAGSSATENNLEKEDIGVVAGTMIGAGAIGTTSLMAAPLVYALEKGHELRHNISAGLICVGGALMALSGIAGIVEKYKPSKPRKLRTKIKTYILDKEYILDPRTFLGIRVLITDDKREDISDLFCERKPSREYKMAEEIFYTLKDAIEGTHKKLPEMLPNERDRELYVIIAKSFIETHYEMMCEFPEIIEEMREYRERGRDDMDVSSHTRSLLCGNIIDKTTAEFVRC